MEARVEVGDRESVGERNDPRDRQPSARSGRGRGSRARCRSRVSVCRRRVVSPRMSTYSGTFHQWLRGAVVASRTLPMIWARGAACLSSARQSLRCSSGSVMALPRARMRFVHVAPAPVLTRLGERMIGCWDSSGMRRRMAVRRGVTAADVAAGQAHAQMDPRAPDREAVLAAGDLSGRAVTSIVSRCVQTSAHRYASVRGAPRRRRRGGEAVDEDRRRAGAPLARALSGRPRSARDGRRLELLPNRSTWSPISAA